MDKLKDTHEDYTVFSYLAALRFFLNPKMEIVGQSINKCLQVEDLHPFEDMSSPHNLSVLLNLYNRHTGKIIGVIEEINKKLLSKIQKSEGLIIEKFSKINLPFLNENSLMQLINKRTQDYQNLILARSFPMAEQLALDLDIIESWQNSEKLNIENIAGIASQFKYSGGEVAKLCKDPKYTLPSVDCENAIPSQSSFAN